MEGLRLPRCVSNIDKIYQKVNSFYKRYKITAPPIAREAVYL